MLVFETATQARAKARARRIFARLPVVAGAPLAIGFVRDLSPHGSIHAGSLMRERRILFETSLASDPADFDRIFVHEIFHFAWLHLGNRRRWSYERLLDSELKAGAAGELGWSAEWRKQALVPADRRLRTRRWRQYACESYCDTAAWLFSGVRRHGEFTLPARFRAARQAWFAESGATTGFSV